MERWCYVLGVPRSYEQSDQYRPCSKLACLVEYGWFFLVIGIGIGVKRRSWVIMEYIFFVLVCFVRMESHQWFKASSYPWPLLFVLICQSR